MAQRAPTELPRFPPATIAASAGAAWGAVGYALLWGHTPWFVGRAFVVSPVGTILLLPVRTVLWGIHRAEGWTDRTFALADSNWWIGLASAAVGATLAVAALLVVRFGIRRLRA